MCRSSHLVSRAALGFPPVARHTRVVYRIAYVANFILTATAGVVFVLLSDLQDAFGLPTWGLGVIAGAGFGGSLVVQILLAPLADRGRTFSVGAVGLAAGAIGSFWFVIADSLITFAASRALVGVGIGLFIVASRKAILGLDEEGSGQRLGTLLSSNVAGFIFGPLLGAFLADYGIDAPFIVLGIAVLVVTPPALWWLRSAPVATSEVDFGQMLALTKRPGVQASVLGQAVLFSNIGIFDGTIDRYLTDLGAGNGLIAAILVAIGAPLVLLPSQTGKLVDRRGGETVMLVALMMSVPALLLYGAVPVIAVVLVAGLTQGMVEAFAFPATQVIVVRETGVAEAAIGQALLDVVGSLMAMTWATIGPALYGAAGARVLFSAAAVNAAVLGFLAHRRLIERDRRRVAAVVPGL